MKGKAMRASSYNIYVDLPGNTEEMLLVHGYTGAYDKVSRRTATYIRSLEVGRPPKPLYGHWSPEPIIDDQSAIDLAEDTIFRLKKRGYLTEKSVEEEETFFSKVAIKLHNASSVPGFIFMPTYDCNLRCGYCFQDHMRTNPDFKHLLRTMTRPLVDRLFEAVPKIELHHSGQEQSSQRNIGFFGGEPMLEKSRPIVEYIMDKAWQLGDATFWAITNGTDLHAYRDLLGPDKIAQIQITLDGPPQEHDKRRIYADGTGSFERIARNITMALDLETQISVRMNIDRNNINHLPDLAEQIISQGWHEYQTFNAYTAPIHAANNHTDIKTTFGSWELDKALTQLREEYPSMKVIGRPDDRIRSQAQAIFYERNAPSLQSTFCGAHSGMYLFDVFGDIYACWERTGDPDIRIGRVKEDGDFTLEEQRNTMWRSRNVTTNPICRKCRYSLHCGGGCAVLAEQHRGEFFTNYCDGFAARFRSSVADAYTAHSNGHEQLHFVEPACDL